MGSYRPLGTIQALVACRAPCEALTSAVLVLCKTVLYGKDSYSQFTDEKVRLGGKLELVSDHSAGKQLSGFLSPGLSESVRTRYILYGNLPRLGPPTRHTCFLKV